jgi:hypothetical protein
VSCSLTALVFGSVEPVDFIFRSTRSARTTRTSQRTENERIWITRRRLSERPYVFWGQVRHSWRPRKSHGGLISSGQSAHPLFQSCFPLRGKSTPVSVGHQGEPEWREPAEHTRQEHPDHGNIRSRAEWLGCRRRWWPRENRPSGRNSNGKKRTWPPLTTNTIRAIARPIASTRINGLPLNSAFPGQRGSRPP